MRNPRVVKKGLDWAFECPVHGDRTWCYDWEDALEAAYGHFCMFHKPLRPLWEIIVTDGAWQAEVVTLADKV